MSSESLKVTLPEKKNGSRNSQRTSKVLEPFDLEPEISADSRVDERQETLSSVPAPWTVSIGFSMSL